MCIIIAPAVAAPSVCMKWSLKYKDVRTCALELSKTTAGKMSPSTPFVLFLTGRNVALQTCRLL